MASSFQSKPPAWFWVVAIALTLWEVMGVWSWWEHWQHGPAAMGNVPTNWDIAYFAALPAWYVWLFAAAVWLGLLSGLLTLARKAVARPVAIVSLIATVAMFGYTFLATNMLEKGFWTAYFPALIIAIGFATVWFLGLATRRGWLR